MRFVRRAAARLAEDKGWSYSIAAADADNDGFVDFYVSNGGLSHSGVNFLYQNVEGTAIQRVLNTDAVDSNHASGGASWSDYDRDSDQDLIVANWGGSSEIYLNNGDGHFEQVPSGAFRRSIHYASRLALGDGDGDLDIVIGNWPNHPGEGLEENVLLENRFADGNWIRIALEGVASNRSAIGALIAVETTADGCSRRQIREVSTHSGWRSQGELTQHFGLGTATAVSNVEIKWPSGHTQTIVEPVINQVLSVRESP